MATPASVTSTSAPSSVSLARIRSMWSPRARSRRTWPPVTHAAMANVPASMRSGITLWRTGWKSPVPSISMVGVPTPWIRPPISWRNSARSESSGSRAAFSMTVVPRAATAAIMTFSVAPTLGKSSEMIAPDRPLGATPSRNPCSEEKRAPIFSRPRTCRSIFRDPMLQPPGMATRARPHRASSGPKTRIDARIRLTNSYGASTESTSLASIARSSSQATSAPRCWRTSPMVRQSWMRGTFESTVRPGANRAAAISFRAEFFAPAMGIEPERRAPPVIRKWSKASIVGVLKPPFQERRARVGVDRRNAGSAGQFHPGHRLGQLGPQAGVVPPAQLTLELLHPVLRGPKVDLAGHLRVGGQHVHPGDALGRGHVQEAAVHDGGFLRPVHPDAERPHGQPDQERSVLGQDAHLALHPSGDDHGCFARPDLALGGDHVHIEWHAYAPVPASCFAWASASSMLPTM